MLAMDWTQVDFSFRKQDCIDENKLIFMKTNKTGSDWFCRFIETDHFFLKISVILKK
jgi:hypothetical protein